MKQTTDQEILELFFARDERAIEQVQEKYGAYCHSIVWNILHQNQDCEECCSDTWLQAWNAIPPARPNALGPYLGRIARNRALNHWRAQHTEKRGGDTVSLALDELSECIPDRRTVEDALDAQALNAALDQFLTELEQEKRVAFVLRYWHCMPLDAIAGRLGCSTSRIKTTLFRTRRALKEYLERKEIFL